MNSLANLVAGIHYDLQARQLECRGYRGHGPWIPLVDKIPPATNRPVECGHCGERAVFDPAPNLSALKSRKD